MFDAQLIAFPPGSTEGVILPRPIKVDTSLVLSDVGSMSITYPINAVGASSLNGYQDVELRYRAGDNWICPPQGRFLVADWDNDPVQEAVTPTRTYTLVSWGWLLSGVVQADISNLDDSGNREFINQTPAEVVATLIGEAQAAGFTLAMSVDNQASTGGWAPSYAPGKAVADILSEARDQGFCEWLMQPDGTGCGRKLVLYDSVGNDLSGGDDPVTLHIGRDLTQAPSKRSLRDLAAATVVAGDERHYLKLDNPGADVPYGLLQTYVSAAGISDAGALQTVAQARLDMGKTVRAELTREITFETARWLPFIDYNLGDTILGPDANGDLVPLRVRQITLKFDSGRWSGNLVLGDRFSERTLAMDRKIRQMSAPYILGGGRPVTAPAPPIQDNTPPPKSSALTASSKLTMVSLHWNGLDENGDPVGAGFDHAEAERDTSGSFASPTVVGTFNSAGDLNDGPFSIGQVYYYRLVIVNQAGTRSAGSTAVSVTVVGVKGPDIELNSVKANQMDVGTLSSITANLGTVNAGTIYSVDIYGSVITSPKIRTDPGSSRLELGAGDGSRSPSTIWFYNTSNERTGSISGDGSALSLIGPGSAGGLGQAEIDLDDGSVSIGTDSRGQVVIASSSTSITLPSANIGGPIALNGSTQIYGGLSVAGALSVSGSFTPGSINTGAISASSITATASITASGSGLFGGNVEVGAASSTSAGSLARLNTVGSRYRIYLDSSLAKYKLDQQPIDVIYQVLDLKPKTWVDKTMKDEDANYSRRSAGFVAEDVQQLSQDNDGVFDSLLIFNAGNLQGLAYDRIAAYLIPVVRDMNDRLAALEAR